MDRTTPNSLSTQAYTEKNSPLSAPPSNRHRCRFRDHAANSGPVVAWPIQPSGTQGQWTMSVLHTFTGGVDGAVSTAGLKFDSVGNLYGTTQSGGLFGNGTVFRLTPKKSGTWAEAEYSFVGGSGDGAAPYAGLLLGTISGTGAVLGTTRGGGASGLGTVFKITAK